MKLQWRLRKILNLLAQMRTAVALLGLCALASMAGTVVVQGLPIEDYVAEYGTFWAQVLWYSGMTDVFRAWWFVGILGFLLVSVSTCLMRNGPAVWREVKGIGWQVPLSLQEKKAGLAVNEARLKAAGFRRAGEVDGVAVWRRGLMNRVGYFAVHAGVLGVAVAGLLSGFAGWRGTLNLREGETDNVVLVWRGKEATPKFLPFQVTNEGFEIEHYPGGMPKRYATTLGITGLPGYRVTGDATRLVEVNRPMRIGAYAFYQASFGDGGSAVKGCGVDLSDGRLVAFEGHVYETAGLPDGTQIELLDFRPFTVETLRGEKPVDVGPSVDYLVQAPDAEALQLRAFLNHPDIVGVADGQRVGGAQDGVVVYRPVRIGMPGSQGLRVSGLTDEVWWRMVARVAAGEDLKVVAGGELAKIRDEKLRVETGLALVQAARTVKELRLSHVLLLEDFELKRYSGLQVAHDPGANLFWLASLILVLGVVLMLGRKFSRVWVKDGRVVVTSPHGRRVVAEVEEELKVGG